jgi:hypothetical protein
MCGPDQINTKETRVQLALLLLAEIAPGSGSHLNGQLDSRFTAGRKPL